MREGDDKEMGYCATKQYMKFISVGGVAIEVNKELDKGARLILMVPLLDITSLSGATYTRGYQCLFEKEEEEKSETITEFADRCRECGAKYGKLLKEVESKSNTSELKPCPFCGTKVKMRKVPLYGYSDRFEFEVKCPKCGCSVDYKHNDTVYRSEEEAIANVVKAWNERKESK